MAKDSTTKGSGASAAARPAKPAKAAKAPRNGWFAQLRQLFSTTRQLDPKVTQWMVLAALGVLVLAAVVGLLTDHLVYAIIVAIPLALLAAVVVMSRRAEAAAYGSIEGKPGSAGAALTSLRRGWFVEQEPVAAEASRAGDLQSAAMVFRAIGRPGVVLVGEGPRARAQKLLAQESKRIGRLAPGVPVTLLRVGSDDAEDVVPVRKLSSKVQRLKPVLTKEEVSVVNKRLKALGGVRPPVPAGMDPRSARPDRKALRGR